VFLQNAGGADGRKEGGENNNYINASHLFLPFSRRHYILAQGPLSGTSADFWQMIMENRSRIIVCLTKTVEKNFIKCYQYFPTSDRRQLKFSNESSDFACKLLLEETKKHYIVRNIELSSSSDPGNVLSVQHLQFVDWPDFGVPENTDHFLEFYNHVRQIDEAALENSSNSTPRVQFPIVCHCSAGIGRTGAFVVVDAVMSLLERQKGGKKASARIPFNDKGIAEKLASVEAELKSLNDLLVYIRKSRMGLIQTAQQLRFCWKTVVDWVHNRDEGSSKSSLEARGSSDLKPAVNGSLSSSNHRKRSSSDQSNKALEQQRRREKVQKMREKLAETERRQGNGVVLRLCYRLRQLVVRHSSAGTIVAVCSVAAAVLSVGVACYILFQSDDKPSHTAMD